LDLEIEGEHSSRTSRPPKSKMDVDGGGLSSAATVPLAGDPPRYCVALSPIAFRCASRKTKHQEKHAKDDGHRQGRYGDEGPTHRLVSLVTDITQSCGAVPVAA
jgi:hypothetical protein